MAEPLGLSEFSDLITRSEFTFTLSENVGSDDTGGGAAIRVERGTRLWEGQVSVSRQYHEDAQALDAAFDQVTSASGGFLLIPPHPAPKLDQDGFLIAGSSPTLFSVAPGGATVTIEGLPAQYRLSAGDFVGWTYGTPARRGVYRVQGTVAANNVGRATVKILPPTPASAGAAVAIVNPTLRAVIVPGSYEDAAYAPALRGARSFRWRQALP